MAYEILPATEATIAEVEVWLDAEEAKYQTAAQVWERDGWVIDKPARGFRCNWDSVKRSWREGHARVDILLVDGEAVGFLDGKDILEIRPDLRSNGHGRNLAEFMVKTAIEEGRSVLEIEIAPHSAEPFWKRMGFIVVPGRRGNGGGIYAYRVLPRNYVLRNGERVPFFIQFYTEDERYNDNPAAISGFSGLGERLADGSIQLPERAFCFEPETNQNVDYFVKIEIDGHMIHFDKCKRELSTAHGVQLDTGYTYYIDRIILSGNSGFGA